jgi:hypothetical protein
MIKYLYSMYTEKREQEHSLSFIISPYIPVPYLPRISPTYEIHTLTSTGPDHAPRSDWSKQKCVFGYPAPYSDAVLIPLDVGLHGKADNARLLKSNLDRTLSTQRLTVRILSYPPS